MKICSRSSFFRALCLGGLKESGQSEIAIAETTPELFEAVLRFLYCNSVDFEKISDCIVEVMIAASQFDVIDLRVLLEGVIAQSLTVQNVVSLFLAADQIHATRLKESCANFARHNAALIHTPALQLPAEELAIFMSLLPQ